MKYADAWEALREWIAEQARENAHEGNTEKAEALDAVMFKIDNLEEEYE